MSGKVSKHYKLWHDHLVLAVRVAMPATCPYTVVHTENLVGLFTCIFVKSTEVTALKDAAISTVKRGLGGRYGNKVCPAVDPRVPLYSGLHAGCDRCAVCHRRFEYMLCELPLGGWAEAY